MKIYSREWKCSAKTSREILYLCFRCSLSTSACGGFDDSIKSDFLTERYLCILRIVHNTSLRSGICILRIVVHNTYYRRAAGPIGLFVIKLDKTQKRWRLMKVADVFLHSLIREQNPLIDLSNKGGESSNQGTHKSIKYPCLCSIWKWMIHLWLVNF